MFTAALFTIVKIRNQPKYPSTNAYNGNNIPSYKRKKFCHFKEYRWAERVLYLMKFVRQRKTNIVCYHLQIESKKIKENNEYNKAETDSQVYRTDQQLPVGSGREEGRGKLGWKQVIERYELLCIKWISYRGMYHTGRYSHYFVVTLNGV